MPRRLDSDTESRPNPDPTLLTTAALEREIRHLKELMDKDRVQIMELVGKDRDNQQQALEVALTQMDRRLGELNELRKAVENDRVQFVKIDVYHPAHEELRRQRQVDGERMVGIQADVKANATNLARLESSVMWLSRLVIGALVTIAIAYAFQRLVR